LNKLNVAYLDASIKRRKDNGKIIETIIEKTSSEEKPKIG
jgi:hypothetical protein